MGCCEYLPVAYGHCELSADFLLPQAYAQAYLKMSLLGVRDIAALTDCTKVLPLPR
jgi:hypothetical protein